MAFHSKHIVGRTKRIPPKIPIDIVEECIDYLHDDPCALYACARVCREWLPRSYSHRFRVLSFGDDTYSSDYTIPGARNITQILVYLSKNIRVCAFVRELRIRFFGEHLRLVYLRELLARLPHLAVCEVEAFITNTFAPTISSCGAPPSLVPKSLHRLCLRIPPARGALTAARTQARLPEILECFTEIGDLELSIQDPRSRYPEEKVRRRSRHTLLKVSKLILDGRYPKEAARYLQVLTSVIDGESLRSLHCPVFALQKEHTEPFSSFLTYVSSALVELSSTDIASFYSPAIHDLPSCTNLATLRLSASLPLLMGDIPTVVRAGMDACGSLIASAPPSVSRVCLTFHPEEYRFVDDRHVQEFVAALQALDWAAVNMFLWRNGDGASMARRSVEVVIGGTGMVEEKDTFLQTLKQAVEAKLSHRAKSFVECRLI